MGPSISDNESLGPNVNSRDLSRGRNRMSRETEDLSRVRNSDGRTSDILVVVDVEVPLLEFLSLRPRRYSRRGLRLNGNTLKTHTSGAGLWIGVVSVRVHRESLLRMYLSGWIGQEKVRYLKRKLERNVPDKRFVRERKTGDL